MEVNSGQTVSSLNSYPNVATQMGTAAGEYQITKATYNGLSGALGLSDWSIATQNEMAAWLFYKTGCEAALVAGHLAQSIADASKIWAAIPVGAGARNHSGQIYHAGPHAGQYQPAMDYTAFVTAYHGFGGS